MRDEHRRLETTGVRGFETLAGARSSTTGQALLKHLKGLTLVETASFKVGSHRVTISRTLHP